MLINDTQYFLSWFYGKTCQDHDQKYTSSKCYETNVKRITQNISQYLDTSYMTRSWDKVFFKNRTQSTNKKPITMTMLITWHNILVKITSEPYVKCFTKGTVTIMPIEMYDIWHIENVRNLWTLLFGKQITNDKPRKELNYNVNELRITLIICRFRVRRQKSQSIIKTIAEDVAKLFSETNFNF